MNHITNDTTISGYQQADLSQCAEIAPISGNVWQTTLGNKEYGCEEIEFQIADCSTYLDYTRGIAPCNAPIWHFIPKFVGKLGRHFLAATIIGMSAVIDDKKVKGGNIIYAVCNDEARWINAMKDIAPPRFNVPVVNHYAVNRISPPRWKGGEILSDNEIRELMVRLFPNEEK